MSRNKLIHWIIMVSFIVGACGISPFLTNPTPTPIFNIPSPEQSSLTTWVISYAGARDWLTELPVEDREDQIRDWAVNGLIGLLGLDVRTITDIGYDQTPVRDGFFFGIANPPSGPGRGFFDGQATYHVLVPTNDIYIDRTIALLLDDHRKNGGEDPAQVVLHRYQIDETLEAVRIQSESPQATTKIRADHGYVEMQINTLQDLESFLGTTDHLSQIRVVNNQIWVAGWNWSNVPVGQITVQDVSALAEGYANALTNGYTAQDQEALRAQYDSQVVAGSLDQQAADRFFAIEDRNRGAAASEPGFSLDAGVNLPPQDTLALLASTGKYPVLTSEVANLQNSFSAWDAAGSFDQRSQAALDLMDHYWNLLDLEKDSADILWSLLDSRVILELAIAAYPSLEPYSADLRSKFEILADYNTPITEYDQATQQITDFASEFAQVDPEASSLLIDGVFHRSKPVYQVARYDGGLQGTEAAMTYFYTDLVAKAWSFNLGQGVPYQVVQGFVPDPLAPTPWGFCPAKEAQGRLWFGLRNEGIDILPAQINFGGLATRVFTLAESETGGKEIEPEYSLGRIIWWWDRHYNAMADYEPQYYRLDQLNRWGAALAWLKGNPELPQLPTLSPDQINRDRQFGQWLNDHASDLKWQYDVPFVQPPGETTEALLTLYSDWFQDCGGTWRFSGGISAPGFDDILTLARERPSLPPGVARSGLSDTSTLFDDITGTGQLRRVITRSVTNQPESVITWDLKTLSQTTRTVNVEAAGSKSWNLGPVKAWVDDSVKRNISISFEKFKNGFAQRLSAEDIPVGELSVRVTDRAAIVEWNPGPLSKIRRSLSKLESQLQTQSFSDAIVQLDNVDYVFPVSDTTAYLKTDDLTVLIRQVPPDALPDESFRLRFGQPGADNAPPVYYEVSPSAPPEIASEWITVNQNRLLQASSAPAIDAQQLTFRSATDGNVGTIYTVGDNVIVNGKDMLFGLDGNLSLFEPALVRKILNVQREAQQTQGTLARGVSISDDTLALIESNQLTLVDSSHPRFMDLQAAFKSLPEEQLRFDVGQDFIAWVTELDGPIVYRAPHSVSLDDFLKSNRINVDQFPARAPPIALEPSLLDEASLTPSTIGLETQVQIVQVPLTPEVQTMIQNGVDNIRWGGRNWRVISNGVRTGSSNAGGNGQGTSPTMVSPENSRITLICPESVCQLNTTNPSPIP